MHGVRRSNDEIIQLTSLPELILGHSVIGHDAHDETELSAQMSQKGTILGWRSNLESSYFPS